MKCSLLICSLLLICIKSLVAQPRSAIAKATVFKTTKGQWRFEQYASNVIKAIFTPVDYQHNEQITAAVISKPYTVFDVAFIHVDADQVFIGKNKEVQLKYTMDENNFRGFQIALKTEDRFKKTLVLGLTLTFAISVFINCGVVMGLLPTKGLTMPFLSYGGSSLLVLSILFGTILNVEMYE